MGKPPSPFVEAKAREAAGEPARAHAAYRTCIERHPDFLPAYAGIARLLAGHGEIGGALQWLSAGLGRQIEDAMGSASVARTFATLVARIELDAWHPDLDRDLRTCLAEEAIDHQDLVRPVATLLLLKHADDGWSIDAGEGAATDPLLLDFLVRCINVEPRLEPRLARMRRDLLDRYADARIIPPHHVRLIAALALQAFAGEYAWAVGDSETHLLDKETMPVLLTCLYRPLIESEAVLSPSDEPLVALLARRTLSDLMRERDLAADMPALTGVAGDETSTRVRRQYEQNPYPRWHASPPADPLSLPGLVASLAGVRDLPSSPWRVLIAGSGTGYEAIDMARRDQSLAITALDLSRASLAYGKRMAEALGVTNVAFLQGDILDLPALPEQSDPERFDLGCFDMVSSTGVLHHMDDPAAGLRALRAMTRPGGVLRLALYSKRARARVREAHRVIARLGLDATASGIRTLRAHILSLPDDDPLAVLRHSDDFYSVSGCRDMLFHVREHWFTLPRIRDLLAETGLRLLALDAPPAALDVFRRAHGDRANRLDLDAWDRLEARHPTLFAGMYHFWCQRPAS